LQKISEIFIIFESIAPLKAFVGMGVSLSFILKSKIFSEIWFKAK
jgi:hypothetical protein